MTIQSKPRNSSNRGKLIVVRYNEETNHENRRTSSHAALCASFCNATQEPWFTVGLIAFLGRNDIHLEISREERLEAPGVQNLLNIASRLSFLAGKSDGLPNYRTFHGQATEVHDFLDMQPPYFFLNMRLARLDIDGFQIQQPIIVPVFLRGEEYYMCGGQSKSKVYRICDLEKAFFTPAGHRLVEHVLSVPFELSGGSPRLIFYKKSDHRPYRILYVPKCTHKEPCNNWDQFR